MFIWYLVVKAHIKLFIIYSVSVKITLKLSNCFLFPMLKLLLPLTLNHTNQRIMKEEMTFYF